MIWDSIQDSEQYDSTGRQTSDISMHTQQLYGKIQQIYITKIIVMCIWR